ncbi:GSK3-beta interaction protein-like [Agrilus planipennis]|uniref:GSK3-beta interaction protein-like n=1 Tax=Agrilus planipennis TaxID=224129 RepID=A0A1W4XB03_AGRPL|nr:GSK3-beta interaction protein-like [Agrilus planipennis]
MSDVTELVLDSESWKLEAEAVIGDIKDHVNEIKICDKLASTNQTIFFNIETLEGNKVCVELSSFGFRVVGSNYDATDLSDNQTECFETPYSLLSSISAGFANSFGNSLAEKLNTLNNI